MQFIEEEEDGTFTHSEDISGIAVERKKNTVLRN